MNIPKISSLVLLLLFAGCTSPAKRGAPDCSRQSFPEFLSHFSADVSFQRQSVVYPLVKMQVIDAEPEPRPHTTRQSQEEVVFPVMPDRNTRDADGLMLETESVRATDAKVLLYKPDTDYQVMYIFERTACWQLTEIQDWSL